MPVITTEAALWQNEGRNIPQRPQTYQGQETTILRKHERARGRGQILDAVGRLIPLEDVDLPDPFFPAHLPVALVDAVFGVRLRHGKQPTTTAERYCRRFGLTRRRAYGWKLPEFDEQKTLTNLMSHYRELGVEKMANEVFESHSLFPGTEITRVDYLVRVAGALLMIGVNALDDIQALRPEVTAEAVGKLPGADEHFVRMLLMYTGDDGFVWGDESVRRFVARALGLESVTARNAESWVRDAAHELVLSPKFLDYQIWRYEAVQ